MKQFRMKKLALRLLLCVVLLGLLVSPVAATALPTNSTGTQEVPYETYTYWKEFGAAEKTEVYCKPMYEVKTVISANSLSLPLFTEITDVCTDENGDVYILDSGAGKVYVTDKNYQLAAVVDKVVYNGETLTFEDAGGIFAKNGTIYIADTKGERVIITDRTGKVSMLLTSPESKLIPEDFTYKPIKLTVDTRDYIYVSCDGSYYGALVYNPDIEFVGFYGANPVPATALDVISNLFNRLFSNDTKRSQQTLSLPYQFVDLVAGPNDFIYTATGRAGELSSGVGQVSVMNPGGNDVLGQQAFNFADISVGMYNRFGQTQNIVGIDVDKDGFFYLIDQTYGRVFWYDEECNLLCVFGGGLANGTNGFQDGTSALAKAVALNGTDVLVCDAQRNKVTVFRITEYGELVRNTQLLTLDDNYEQTIEPWEEVIRQDQNSQLAYRGLAKAYYNAEDNQKASNYAELGADRDIYAKAFTKIRTVFFEKHFALVFIGVLVLAAALIAYAVFKRKTGFQLIKNAKVRVVTDSLMHPVESFRLVKEKQMGSVGIALVLLLIFYILSAIKDTAAGFAFNKFDAASYNSFFVLLSTVGLVVLWTVANWLVCVLLGGIGKLKEIFIVTCYSLVPMIFSTGIGLLFTFILTPDEYVFVTIFQGVCVIYTAFMLILGIMKIHDFEFGRFLGTTILTVISMLIILFLLFLIILLAQQVWSWVYTVFIEIRYR